MPRWKELKRFCDRDEYNRSNDCLGAYMNKKTKYLSRKLPSTFAEGSSDV